MTDSFYGHDVNVFGGRGGMNEDKIKEAVDETIASSMIAIDNAEIEALFKDSKP